MSRLWKSMSIIFVALIVGAILVTLVVVQPWGDEGSSDVAPATRQPTAAPKPELTAGEVCSIVREKQQRRCCYECTALFSASLGSWNIACDVTSSYAGSHFSYREATRIVVAKDQAADLCLRPRP